jgi:glycosyltransferase involved in cell wall biosynthesis
MSRWDDVARDLRAIATALEIEIDLPGRAGRRSVIAAALGLAASGADLRFAYLSLAVLTRTIPTPEAVLDLGRRSRVDGGRAITTLVVSAARRRDGGAAVRIDHGVVVDLTDTIASDFTTGIQRVARETVGRWVPSHELTIVSWDRARLRLIRVDGVEGRLTGEVVVPFGGTIVLPEIAVDRARAIRLSTIARFGGGRAAAIGFDCIPLTTAEVAGPGMPGAFAGYLSALASFDVVAPISAAAALEYRGWRRMLSGAGLDGPRIESVDLAYDASASVAATPSDARAAVGVGDDETVVLVIGSHEPRKNHQRVLAAAERLWSHGHEFVLVMVGGNSWNAGPFHAEVARLQRRNRRVVLGSRLSDEIVWGLYATAAVSVFPSLNEGFGLPVVESLALGTPVVTSDFGSTRDLGAGRGAVLVDPRRVHEIADAIESVIADPVERARLVALAETLPERSWDDYAAEVWATLVTAP